MSPDKIGTRFIRNVYRLITLETVSAEIAQAEMAPALLVGRMEVPPALDAAFNTAYNTERLPLYRSIPGYIRARRFVAVRREPADEPQYITVHECQRPEVADDQSMGSGASSAHPGVVGALTAAHPLCPGLSWRLPAHVSVTAAPER